jgi:hypothetical protein
MLILLIKISKWCPGAGSNHRHCDFQLHLGASETPSHHPEPITEVIDYNHERISDRSEVTDSASVKRILFVAHKKPNRRGFAMFSGSSVRISSASD